MHLFTLTIAGLFHKHVCVGVHIYSMEYYGKHWDLCAGAKQMCLAILAHPYIVIANDKNTVIVKIPLQIYTALSHLEKAT